VLQCVAVCCSVLQCVAVRCSVLQCVAVCCSLLQCVAVCCSVFLASINPLICSLLISYRALQNRLNTKTTLQHTVKHCNCTAPQKLSGRLCKIVHTATHCNTLQHTATHCNTLQLHRTPKTRWKALQDRQHTQVTLKHTATHCNPLQPTATHYITMHHTQVTLKHTAKRCNTLQPTAMHCSALQLHCTS